MFRNLLTAQDEILIYSARTATEATQLHLHVLHQHSDPRSFEINEETLTTYPIVTAGSMNCGNRLSGRRSLFPRSNNRLIVPPASCFTSLISTSPSSDCGKLYLGQSSNQWHILKWNHTFRNTFQLVLFKVEHGGNFLRAQ
jgi:hypothetical protein